MESKKINYNKLILPGILVVLLIVFIAQNLEIVPVSFLWMDGHIHLINLVLICFGIGALSAWSLSFYRKTKKNKNTVDVNIIETKPSKDDGTGAIEIVDTNKGE